jgi:hypothetical protein
MAMNEVVVSGQNQGSFIGSGKGDFLSLTLVIWL